MNSVLRFLSQVRERVARAVVVLFGADWGQVVVVLVGVILAGVSSWLMFRGRQQADHARSFALAQGGAFLFGVSISICAAALVARVLHFGKPGKYSPERDAGVQFFGSKEEFDQFFRWDSWIRETPRGANLLVVGQKNLGWYDAWEAVRAVLAKDVRVQFIFVGTQDETTQYVRNFLEELNHRDPDPPATFERENLELRRVDPIDGRSEDSGFYWNGRQLLIKLYLPDVKNPDCPILALRAPGAGGMFRQEDFDKALIQLQCPGVLIRSAQALGYTFRQSEPIDKAEWRRMLRSV